MERLEFSSYREMIAAELNDRQVRNPRYSMRAFARDLKLSVSFLSNLLAGKRSLSGCRAIDLAACLGWDFQKTQCFLTFVFLEQLPEGAVRRHLQVETKRLLGADCAY